MGFPTDMFPVLFCIARTAGWLAHWREQLGENVDVFRPKTVYEGYGAREYVPIHKRKKDTGGDSGKCPLVGTRTNENVVRKQEGMMDLKNAGAQAPVNSNGNTMGAKPIKHRRKDFHTAF
jgi:hypothetical protein